MTDIYNKGVMNDDDHIRIINAVWNSQGKAHTFVHPRTIDPVYAVSGFVLVFDSITNEYKCYWGTFAADRVRSEALQDARHIAMWGNKVSDSVRDVFFPFVKDMEKAA